MGLCFPWAINFNAWLGSQIMNDLFMQFFLPLSGGAIGVSINAYFIKRWIDLTDRRLHSVIDQLSKLQAIDAGYRVEIKNLKSDVDSIKTQSLKALNATVRLDAVCRVNHGR